MKSTIFIVAIIAALPGAANAALQASVSSSGGSWCYNGCTSAGCTKVMKCQYAQYIPSNSCDSDFSSVNCYLGTSGNTTVVCDLDGSDACDECGVFDGSNVEGDWVSVGSNRVSQTTYSYTLADRYTCNASVSVVYGCAANYYTTGSRSSSMTCTACPSNATCGGIGNADGFTCNKGYYKNGSACTACGGDATTKGAGATSQSECYIPSGTSFSDDVGAGAYTDDCYY